MYSNDLPLCVTDASQYRPIDLYPVVSSTL